MLINTKKIVSHKKIYSNSKSFKELRTLAQQKDKKIKCHKDKYGGLKHYETCLLHTFLADVSNTDVGVEALVGV